MAINPEILNIHKKLLTDISDEMAVGTPEYDNFIEHMKGPGMIPRGVWSQKKTLLEKFDALATRGKLKPGDYETLKAIAEKSNNQDVVKLIEDAEKDIAALGVRTQPLNTARTEPSSSAKGSRSGEEPSSTKRAKLDEEESDPLFVYKGEQGYYDHSGKKGLMLILNSRENRKGTDEDVRKLKEFFGKKLKFKVYDPRLDKEHDFTTEQVNKLFESVLHQLNDELIGKDYYCFICVIMAHGQEGEFKTKDGTMSVEAIRKRFNNHNVPNFTGKPKVFFVQACQGYRIQGGEEVDDLADDMNESENDKNNFTDESDEIIRVPTDADTLLAFATTPGYQSFRRVAGSEVGSWFITECLKEFEKNHRKHHLEDMLITVRQNVAHHWNRSDGGKQMPCVWSTLTKRLMLAKAETD